MPLIKSAVKRMKQTAKRRQRNIGIKRYPKQSSKRARYCCQERPAQKGNRQPPQISLSQGR